MRAIQQGIGTPARPSQVARVINDGEAVKGKEEDASGCAAKERPRADHGAEKSEGWTAGAWRVGRPKEAGTVLPSSVGVAASTPSPLFPVLYLAAQPI